MTSRFSPPLAPLRKDTRGQVFVEYLVLVVVTGAALVLLVGPVVGPRIVSEYAKRRSLLYATYP
jgi:hypothetical protein